MYYRIIDKCNINNKSDLATENMINVYSRNIKGKKSTHSFDKKRGKSVV